MTPTFGSLFWREGRGTSWPLWLKDNYEGEVLGSINVARSIIIDLHLQEKTGMLELTVINENTA